MLPFVDISDNNGVYNMAANSDQLIAIRMSSGDGGLHFDTQAAANYANASKAGKLILQYHYCGTGDPAEEAEFFLKACSPYAQYDMYCIDAEMGQTKAWKQTFADVVKNATGCNVIDYMNISLANSLGPLPDCALWLAAPSWGFNQTITELNSGIEYIMQQGPVVNGVDSDMCFITKEVLQKYGYQPPPLAAPVAASPQTPPAAPAAPPAPVTPPVTVSAGATNAPASTTTYVTTNTPAPAVSTVSVTAAKPTTTHQTVNLSWWEKLLSWLHL